MLGVSSYPKDYVDECRANFAAAVSKYRAVAKTASKASITAFEPVFFANLVLALDACFVHRLRAKELKDGNPLNEVRVLCTSIMTNQGVVLADKTIKMKPDQSVLGYEVGDRIALTETDFGRLAKAFFAEIEAKFG
jgi:hypothetical protein